MMVAYWLREAATMMVAYWLLSAVATLIVVGVTVVAIMAHRALPLPLPPRDVTLTVADASTFPPVPFTVVVQPGEHAEIVRVTRIEKAKP